jgi:hypothetical protein
VSELTVQEAALAWAQGKIVEVMVPASIAWAPVIKVGGGDGEWLPGVFAAQNPNYRFRLAPVPPAKKWRPWTAEEVPVDAWFKGENGIGFKLTHADLWSGSKFPTVANGSGAHHSLNCILKIWTHSIDHGKTWLPCGVEVTE